MLAILHHSFAPLTHDHSSFLKNFTLILVFYAEKSLTDPFFLQTRDIHTKIFFKYFFWY